MPGFGWRDRGHKAALCPLSTAYRVVSQLAFSRCRRARCLSVARYRCVAAAAPAVTAGARRLVTLCPPISLQNGGRGECDVALCGAARCSAAVCLFCVPACWLAAHQSRCATHRSATREGCSEDWRQRVHPLRHKPAAAPDLGVLVVSWRARRWDARADA